MDVIRGLQAHLTEFNVFDLFGTAHLELAHTRILAFLFDPLGQHGFGAAFGDRFLRAVADANDPGLVRRHFGDPALWVFEPADILREQESMDLRVIDPTNRVAVLVENKVHTSEHDDQLSRYWSAMLGHYPPDEWRAIPIYLTLVGEAPSDPTYLAGDYRMVARVLEGLLADGAFDCSAPVRMTLEHYRRMIRREFVGDWDLAAQAKRL